MASYCTYYMLTWQAITFCTHPDHMNMCYVQGCRLGSSFCDYCWHNKQQRGDKAGKTWEGDNENSNSTLWQHMNTKMAAWKSAGKGDWGVPDKEGKEDLSWSLWLSCWNWWGCSDGGLIRKEGTSECTAECVITRCRTTHIAYACEKGVGTSPRAACQPVSSS